MMTPTRSIVLALALALAAGCSSTETLVEDDFNRRGRAAVHRRVGRGVAARLWALTTGGLLLLATLPFLTDLVGLPLLFLGLLIITMAWLRDVDTVG